MKTTPQWLDAAKTMHSLSDYALAPKLGITRSQMSRYRTGADYLSEEAALKLADLLRVDAAQIIASAHAERAKSGDVKAFWMQWAERLGGVTAAVVLGVGLASSPAPSQAAQTPGQFPSLCIMSSCVAG